MEQQQIREQIASHVAEYLKNGGKIQVLESFQTSNDKTWKPAGPTTAAAGRDD